MNLVRMLMKRTGTQSIRAERWTDWPWIVVSGETRLNICSIMWLLDIQAMKSGPSLYKMDASFVLQYPQAYTWVLACYFSMLI